MATASESAAVDAPAGEHGDDDLARVDPRAPRVGQAITASGLTIGIALDLPVAIYAVTVLLVVPVLSGWRVDPYGALWKGVFRRLVDPVEPEPAAPHRFARVMGAVGTTLASGLLLAGFPLVAYVIAGAIVAAAALAAVAGICLGCRMYRSVSLFRRLNVV